jgi:hypothetical protein
MTAHRTFDAQSSLSDRDRNSLVNTQYSLESMKNVNFDSGPIINPLREPSCLQEKGRRHMYHESLILSNSSSASDSSSRFVLRGTLAIWSSLRSVPVSILNELMTWSTETRRVV